jgi:AbrB family looped-hinge helix DNA binding protein
MALAQSKLTSQAQISIPVEVRKKLGVGPGSVLDWNEEDGKIVVSRAGKYTFADMRKILFPKGPPKRQSLKQLKEGIGEYIEDRHASGRY